MKALSDGGWDVVKGEKKEDKIISCGERIIIQLNYMAMTL